LVDLAADTQEEKGPLRTCIATRVVRPVEEMLRFVLGPEGEIVADLKHKLPGRGVWVTANAATVGEAVRRKAFQRGFKRSGVTVSSTLAETVDELMQRDALQALAMANKAGAVVTGSTKVEAAIMSGGAAVLLHASDGSPDGIRKLDSQLRQRRSEAADATPKINLFRSEQLDLALGRTNVIHAALAGGGTCDAFLARCRRIAFYRSGASVDARGGSANPRNERDDGGSRRGAGEAINGQGPGT
jgi:uncharacterized protein